MRTSNYGVCYGRAWLNSGSKTSKKQPNLAKNELHLRLKAYSTNVLPNFFSRKNENFYL